MSTVKDLKEWLNKFPDDAIVEVAFQDAPPAYTPFGEMYFDAINLEGDDCGEGWEFVDFRNNPFVKEDYPSYGKCVLKLGQPN